MNPRKRPELTERSILTQSYTSAEATPKRRTFDWISEPHSYKLTPFHQLIIVID